MKIKSFLPIVALTSLAVTELPSQTLTYNPGQNLGWFDATNTQWGAGDPIVYDQNWASGSSAVINNTGGGYVLNFTGTTAVANLTTSLSGGAVTLQSSSGSNVLNFSGGTITHNGAFSLVIGDRVSIQGDFIKSGSGQMTNEGTNGKVAYVGTATVNQGILYYSNSVQLGASSNFVVAGGTFLARQSALSMGSLTVNSGNAVIGRANNTADASLTVTSLSGTGGSLGVATNTNVEIYGMTVNQTTNTTYSGSINGLNNNARMAFSKSGVGHLSLSGDITLARQTTVNGGGLFINSSTTNFSDEVGTTAIQVSTGTLGGTGVITVSDGSNVVLGANGQLAAGLLGSAGRTTFELGSGILDLSSATASLNNGWLKFELGGLSTPGITYDQIMLSTGVLNIGADLNFEDFSFTALGGFTAGTYVLFSTTEDIEGSLGVTTGTIGSYDAELTIQGNNLILSVIPEPNAVALVALGISGMAWSRRRRLA